MSGATVQPVRLTILRALCSEIERRAGLEGAVFRGRAFFGPASGGPERMVSVFEDGGAAEDYPVQAPNGATGLVRLPLILMGYDVEDFDHPTDNAYLMLDRVEKAVRDIKREGAPSQHSGVNYLGLGGVVSEVLLGSGHVFPAFANELTSVAFFQLPITLAYAERQPRR